MPIKVLSYEEIYSAISLHNIKYKAIITFMLSTGFNTDTIINLTINDLLRGCGKDEGNIDSLKELVKENPFEVLPYWINKDESNFKLIFNSYESTFYLFLYLEKRLSDNKKCSCDEVLFASNNNGDVFKESTLLTTVSRPYENDDFRIGSIILTFNNICENFVSDNEVKELFLGNSTRYNNENELYEALNDELFKEKLINEYNKLIPSLTAGKYIYEHLKNYVSNIPDETNYRQVIENYYYNNFDARFKKRFDDVNFGKMLYYAYRVAKKDIENGTYEETYSYFNKILTQAEIYVIFHKTETRLGSDRYRNYDYESISPTNPHIRKDMVLDCILKMNILDRLNLSPEEMEHEVIRQLGLHDCLLGDFNYDLFQQVLLDTIYARLEANNRY